MNKIIDRSFLFPNLLKYPKIDNIGKIFDHSEIEMIQKVFFGLLILIVLPGSLLAKNDWVKSANGKITGLTLFGGKINGKDQFLCAGYHNGVYHPGSIIGNSCVFAYDGKENKIKNYYTIQTFDKELTRLYFVWNFSQDGNLPSNIAGSQPVIVGEYKGKSVYICRVKMKNGDIHAGKAIDNKCNVIYQGKEISYDRNFQYLKTRPLPADAWTAAVNGQPADGMHLFAGKYNGKDIFLCAGYREKSYHPGKLVDGKCIIGVNGEQVEVSNFFTLKMQTKIPIDIRYKWIKSSNGNMPKENGYAPVPLGNWEGKQAFICRVEDNKSEGILPGKLVGDRCLYPAKGKENSSQEYQVLFTR